MELLKLIPPNAWIFLAAGSYTLGYLIINQMILRTLVMAGGLCYIAYYLTAADLPLWGAIFSTLITLTANAIGMTALVTRNMKWRVPVEHRDIYPLFDPLPPGDFRALMAKARRYVTKEERQVTRVGEAPTKIYYVVSGTFSVQKYDTAFSMEDETFVGEVAYLMDRPSAATTTFPAGLEVIEWDREQVAKTSARNPRFKLALEAIMSRDLARKVGLAIAPATYSLDTQAARDPEENSPQSAGA